MRSLPVRTRGNQVGFTIVEFMVATMVFGVVLLAATMAITQIGRSYKRSLHASSTQAATRTLVDTVAQAVQFSSSEIVTPAPAGETLGYCIGGKQFLFVLGRQISPTASATTTPNAALVRPNNNCQMQDVLNTTPADNPKELLGRGMRLSKLEVNAVSDGLYTISARVIYGSDDLLCSPAIVIGSAGSCTRDGDSMSETDLKTRTDIVCKPGIGSQFCAASELSVTVQRRL